MDVHFEGILFNLVKGFSVPENIPLSSLVLEQKGHVRS